MSRSRLPILKSFTFPHTILGSSTGTPWPRGLGGTNIPEFGMAAPISHLDSASESGFSAASDGDGAIGDSTGATTTQNLTIAGISPRAEHFTTATPFTEEVRTAGLTAPAAESMEPVDSTEREAAFLIVPARDQGPSKGAGRQPEVMLRRAVKATSARELSATMTMAESRGVIHRVEPPASVAEHRAAEEGVSVAVVAAVGVAAEVVAANCRYN